MGFERAGSRTARGGQWSRRGARGWRLRKVSKSGFIKDLIVLKKCLKSTCTAGGGQWSKKGGTKLEIHQQTLGG